MSRLFFALLLVVPLASAADSNPLMPSVVTGFQELAANGRVRAVAVGLLEDGEPHFIGMGRLARDNPNRPAMDTLFEIGSVSKVFTALLTQLQVDEGNLDWDAPISKYLPAVDFANPDVAAITLRELATHESGLPRLPSNMKIEDPLDPYAGFGRDELVAFLQSFDPQSLDKKYEYSNLGAGLLGLIATESAGYSDYGQAIAAEISRPLALADTHTVLDGPQRERLANGFSNGADMPNWSGFDAMAGAGALLSSVADLLEFARANLQDGAMATSLAAIREPQPNGETALGWHVREMPDGDTAWWHNGGTGGYASFLGIRPDRQSAVVILTASTEYNTVTELGFRQLSGQEPELTEVDLAPFPGTYQLGPAFKLKIFEDAGSLFGQATGQAAFPLTPVDSNTFEFTPAGIRIEFQLGDDRAQSLELHQAGNITPAPRVEGEAERQVLQLAAEELVDFAGKYQMAPTTVITVEARGDQLYAQLTGQAAYPVFAYDTDRFFYKVVDAQLEFERDGEGAVIAVILHQNGHHRAPRTE